MEASLQGESATCSPKPAERGRIAGLDALRGLAAMAVLLYHCHALLSLQMWPAWTGYLSMAVPLFFALSAFSLCLRYSGRLGVSDTVASFYLRRYLRIAPLFYFMMIVYLMRRVFHGWDLPSVKEIVLNLTFLFPLDPDKNESLVAAGWSLGLEMIFYGIFPLIIAFTSDVLRAAAFFVVAVIIQAMAGSFFFHLIPDSNFYWLSFPTQFAFFAGGILAFHAYLSLERLSIGIKPRVAVFILGASMFSLLFGTVQGIFEIRVDGWPALRPLIGFLLTFIAVALALRPFRVLVNRVTVFLGDISYGLYLIHPFIITILGKPLFAALEAVGFGRVEAAWLAILAVVVATTLAAIASFYWLERPMIKLQKFARER